MTPQKRSVYTIGHSNRPVAEFLDLLKAHGIRTVVDIRTIPQSRHNPQFGKDALRTTLKNARISYEHLKALGGLRRPEKDSVNLGWRNASFRGFADYMGTSEFAHGLARLKDLVAHTKTAVMCAEAVPWRCHRSLIADALTAQHWRVFHIQSRKTAPPHALTPFLEVRAGTLLYPKKARRAGGSRQGAEEAPGQSRADIGLASHRAHDMSHARQPLP
ncbi:MAG: DUF488 family protein [Candidatus Rokuibacteriota bacterium]